LSKTHISHKSTELTMHNFWKAEASLISISTLATVSPTSVISHTVFKWLSKLLWNSQWLKIIVFSDAKSYSFEAVINISQDMWYLGFSQQFLEDERLLEWYPVQTGSYQLFKEAQCLHLQSAGALVSSNYYQLKLHDIPKDLRIHFRETCCLELYKTN